MMNEQNNHTISEFIRIEILFNSVEAELASRWIGHDVPAHFTHRPVTHLRKVVNAWWHVYQESACAGQALDRSSWEREVDRPGFPLDTPTLIASLEEIHSLGDLRSLLSFRELHAAEIAAICLLANVIRYCSQAFYQKSEPMNSNLVIFAPMDEQHTPLALTSVYLKAVAQSYTAVLSKAGELLPSASQDLLSGTAGVTYLKLKGHKKLSREDLENIIQALGTEADREVLKLFREAQDGLSNRLKTNKWVVLIAEQSAIPYYTVNRRISKPADWKAKEMIKIADVLQRLQV